MKRRGVFVNVAVTPFGRGKDGKGGVFPHEKTHAGPKIDRLKLMHATRAQLSPIFGLFNDPQDSLRGMIDTVIAGGDPDMRGTTGLDDVLHEVWTVPETSTINKFVEALSGKDIYIADGHHRYTTAMNYQQELVDKRGPLPADHPANYCMFVLVSMQDPGMIVLPTHRVLGGMADFSLERFTQLAEGRLKITRFDGNDLASLEAAVTDAGKGAMGLYDPRNPDHPYWIAAPAMDDPLGKTFPDRSKAWRDLDVAIVQHLIVEEICEKNFCPDGGKVAWKFPHSLDQVKADTNHKDFQLGVILQPTPLESVKLVCEAGEVMPQKSTFFYPKVATGLVMNPLE